MRLAGRAAEPLKREALSDQDRHDWNEKEEPPRMFTGSPNDVWRAGDADYDGEPDVPIICHGVTV